MITVRQLFTLYHAEQDARVKSGALAADSTLTRRRYAEMFVAAHGDRPAKDCTNGDLVTFLADHPEWASSHTKSDVCGGVVSAFRWATERRYLEACPMTKPRGFWLPPRPRKAITPAEYKAVQRFARLCNGVNLSGRRKRPSSSAFRLALHFLWASGCRTKEMRTVQWSDVDLDHGVIVMETHKTFAKTGMPRIIPITRNINRLLHVAAAMQLRRGQLTGPVFRSGRGHRWGKSTYGKMFRAYATMAGIRPGITSYCCRHGFTVRGLEAGIGERQLADVLGHASTRYVSYYGHTTRRNADYLRNIAEQIAKAGRKAPPNDAKRKTG